MHIHIPRTLHRTLLSILASLIMLGTAKPAFAADGMAAAQFAMNQVGKPYQFGGTGPNGYDMPGLTMASWAAGGVALPHSMAGQWAAVPHLPCGTALQAGDLVFRANGGTITAISIYISSGQVVLAASPVVKLATYNSFMSGGTCHGIGRP